MGQQAYGSKLVQFKPSKALSNLRQNGRIEIRENEGVNASIEVNNSFKNVSIFDISSSGVCILCNEHISNYLELNKRYNIVVNFSWEKEFRGTCVVIWKTNINNNSYKVGLKFEGKINVANEEVNKMILVPENYPIIGYTYKDIFYYEKSIVKISKISKKYAELVIFDKEALYLPNKSINIIFSLSTRKSEKLSCNICSIIENNSDNIKILAEISDFSKHLENDFVNHLTLNPATTLKNIRDAGFRIKNISNNFKFRFVRTHEEYIEVLKLRFEAYKNASKVRDGATYEDMVAPLDNISRILIAFHGEKIIASVAMSFPNDQSILLDTERALSNGYPDYIPPKIEMIEISRLCTDPLYRQGDLLLRMFEHIYKVFATSGRKYLISSTDEKLWSLYKKLGFKKLNLSYEHPYLNKLKHEIILIDLTVPISGSRIDPLRWSYLYGNMTNFLFKRTTFKESSMAIFRRKIYNFLFRFVNKNKKEY
jgi:hypothetical protein